MATVIQTYIDLLGSNAGALSAISALQSLDATVKKNDASIKTLEKSYADAVAAANQMPKGGVGWANSVKAVKDAEDKLGKAREKQSLALAKQDTYRKGLEKQIEGTRAAQAAEAQRAAQSKTLLGAIENIKGSLGGLAEQAKGAGGPVGSLVSKVQSLGKGGAVGVAIAIVAALGALALAGVYAAASLTRYAIGAADAARSSRLLSEAALGSARAGTELEMVIDQMSNLAPSLSTKLKEVGRSLADVNIRGRDAQRVLNTFGLVATARGEQAAGAIKSIAESSQTARRLMLGPFNRLTGEFDSLRGTSIKAADVFKAVAKTMGTTEEAARTAVVRGFVPFKKGMEALELAAQDKLGGVVAKQMLSLSTQAEKLKENVSKLFSGVAIDTFLSGLKTVTDLFDQNTVTGYVLREVFTAVFSKIASLAALAFPYIVAGIKGAVFGVLLFAKVAKQAYVVISALFSGGSKAEGIALAFKLGAMAVGALVGAVAGLAASFVVLGVVAAVALAPIWVPIAIGVALMYVAIRAAMALGAALTSAFESIKNVDLSKAAENIINGLIKGIKNKVADVKSAILEVSSAITSAFNSDQEIRSPGRKAMRQGRYVVEGQAIGMVQAVPMVERASMKASGAVTRGLGSSNGDSAGQSGQGGQVFNFNYTNCNFGEMTQAKWEEMNRVSILSQLRGFAGQS